MLLLIGHEGGASQLRSVSDSTGPPAWPAAAPGQKPQCGTRSALQQLQLQRCNVATSKRKSSERAKCAPAAPAQSSQVLCAKVAREEHEQDAGYLKTHFSQCVMGRPPTCTVLDRFHFNTGIRIIFFLMKLLAMSPCELGKALARIVRVEVLWRLATSQSA